MKYILFIAMTLMACYALNHDQLVANQFVKFKLQYQKTYQLQEEELYRFSIFRENYNQLESLRQMNPNATFGITKFTDLTTQEFLSIYTGQKLDENYEQNKKNYKPQTVDSSVPNGYFTWRNDKKIVTHVKDQGHCGSCWSFSATGVLEGQARTGQSLSTQEMVSCYGAPCEGCGGCWAKNALSFVSDNGGVNTWEDYPYSNETYSLGEEGKCQFDKLSTKAKRTNVDKVVYVGTNFFKTLLDVGPLSMALDASTLKQYTGGVVNGEGCVDQSNHAVLATGFCHGGNCGKVDWYEVKNSWGTSWGENGYFRIEANNACGSELYFYYPTLRK